MLLFFHSYFLHRPRIIELNEYNPVVSLILRYLICKGESAENEDENDINDDKNYDDDDDFNKGHCGRKKNKLKKKNEGKKSNKDKIDFRNGLNFIISFGLHFSFSFHIVIAIALSFVHLPACSLACLLARTVSYNLFLFNPFGKYV